MAEGLDHGGGRDADRHYDSVTHARQTTSPGATSGVGHERLLLDSGTSAFESFRVKRKRPNDPEDIENADTTPHYGYRNAGVDNRVSYDELAEQVRLLTCLSLDNQNSNLALSKRYKEERDFGSIGNKSQHTLNLNVVDACDEGCYALASKRYNNAENCFLDIKHSMLERNKLVLIAENSEFGWATVAAYQKNKTFLDDEEDKRFKRAETFVRATRKEKSESAAKAKGRGVGRGRGGKGPSPHEVATPVVATQSIAPHYPTAPPAYAVNPFGHSFMPEHFMPYYGMQPFPAQAGHFPGQNFKSQQVNKAPVKCYGCMQYGHIKTECPNRHLWANPPANK
jgi:hypothetical protein